MGAAFKADDMLEVRQDGGRIYKVVSGSQPFNDNDPAFAFDQRLGEFLNAEVAGNDDRDSAHRKQGPFGYQKRRAGSGM